MPAPEPAQRQGVQQRPVRPLIVGWSSFGALVLEQLDEFLAAGSSIHVLVDGNLVEPSVLEGTGIQHGVVTVSAGAGGPEDVFALAEGEPFDQVIVLGYRDALSPADADARTLLSLLALRMVWPREADDHVRIVAELVDQRNLAIAIPVGIDDLIVSDALASLMMAQLSENPGLLAVFEACSTRTARSSRSARRRRSCRRSPSSSSWPRRPKVRRCSASGAAPRARSR